MTVIRIARGWAQVRLDGNGGWVAETVVLIDAHAPTTETSAEASVDVPAGAQLHDATAAPAHCKHGTGECGDNHALSNLGLAPFTDRHGNKHDTLERWFQSRKTNAAHLRSNCCSGNCCSLGHAAKKAGRHMKMAARQLREQDSGGEGQRAPCSRACA